MKTKNTLNKSLELSPGVPDISVAAIPVNLGSCAMVGGAAQLHVMHGIDSVLIVAAVVDSIVQIVDGLETI